MKYRPEIDGLRALAVLPVIFYHAGFPLFSGGFIGVDIFFVISGYLITSIIVADLIQNKFSIVDFYERRARRILPALTNVLIVTTVLAYLFMPAELLKEYSQSVVSVVAFASNIFFFLETDYFALTADEMPLLHTWSLAVEEQYYVFFPLLLAACWGAGQRLVITVIVALSIFSLATAHYWTYNNNAEMSFYLIFSRAWELFLGALLAFIPSKNKFKLEHINSFFSLLGVALLVYASLFFDKTTPHPSLYTLTPVLGTLLIIHFASHRNIVGIVLSHRFFVSIGLISYSLYLWHQPIFAFLRMKSIGEPSILVFSVAMLVSLILAALSYRYVETPFRNKKKYQRKQIFQYSLVSLTIFLGIGLLGHVNQGFEQRFNLPSYSESIVASPKRQECHSRNSNYLRPENACRYFGSQVTWAAFGDSHIIEPAYALANELQRHDQGLLHLTFSGCEPALNFDVDRVGCSQWLNESLRYLESNTEIENILLGFRHSAHLFGDNVDFYPEVPHKVALDVIGATKTEISDQKLLSLYWDSFDEIIERLVTSGKTVYLLYPIPELPIHISKAAAPFWVFSAKTMLNLTQTTTSEYYFARHNYILSKLDTLQYGEDLKAIKPYSVLCPNDGCAAVMSNKALYYDDDHLSIYGAQLLVEYYFANQF